MLRTNVDAIQEFKFRPTGTPRSSDAAAARWSTPSSSPGRNHIHGNVFEFFRNSALDARDYFEPSTDRKASYKQNQFGGTLRRPLIKDKLFWFGDYQGTRIRNPLNWNSKVPTAAERTGDFLVGARRTDRLRSGNWQRRFPGNMIPSDRIDPISQAYMNLYPDANAAGSRYIIFPIEQDGIDQGDGRVDYTPSETNQFFVRYSQSGRKRRSPRATPGLANGGDSSTGDGHEDTRALPFGFTHAFTPRIVNEARIGFNHVHIRRGVPVDGNVLPSADLRVLASLMILA